MATPERDPVYSRDESRTVYTRESNGTGWFVGIIVALALLAIGYLVFSANTGPATVDTTVTTTAPAVESTAPMTTAPATEVAPPAAPVTPAAPEMTTPAPAAPAAPETPVVPAN
jgi:hypothetical protein